MASQSLTDILWLHSRVPFVLLQNSHYLVILLAFIGSQLIYYFTHYYCKGNAKFYKSLSLMDKVEFQSRVASTVHAVIVFPIVAYVVLTDTEYNNNPVFGRNEWSDIAMCFSIGYFLSDSVLVLKYWIPPVVPIMCHHIFAGWGFLLAIGAHGSGRWFGCYLLLTEATAIWNNGRWSLIKIGYDERTTITQIFGYMFTLNWIVFRLLINPFLLYKIYNYWSDIIKSGPFIYTLLGLNIIFLILLNTTFFFVGPFKEICFGKQEIETKTEIPKSPTEKKFTDRPRISSESHTKPKIQ